VKISLNQSGEVVSSHNCIYAHFTATELLSSTTNLHPAISQLGGGGGLYEYSVFQLLYQRNSHNIIITYNHVILVLINVDKRFGGIWISSICHKLVDKPF